MRNSTLEQNNNSMRLLGLGLFSAATIMLPLIIALSIIKTILGLALISMVRFLIPNFIRGALVRILPSALTRIAAPMILLFAGAAAKFHTAREHVLRLRQQRADEESAEQNGETNRTNDTPLERVGITTQTFITKYERELYMR